MAGWGALGGLGQGLTNASGMILDHNKEKMRNKLELEREQRQDQRQKDKEAREQAQFSGQYRTDFANGVRYKLNKAGETMGEPEPIPSHELNQFNRTERTAGLQEQILGHDLTVKGAQAGVANDLAGLSVAEKKAAIRARDAQTESSLASADNSRASAAYTRAGKGKGLEDALTAPERSEVVTSMLKDLGSFGEDVPKAELIIIAEDALTHAENMKRKGMEVDPVQYARTLIANRYGEGYGDRGKRDTLTPLESNERVRNRGTMDLNWR